MKSTIAGGASYVRLMLGGVLMSHAIAAFSMPEAVPLNAQGLYFIENKGQVTDQHYISRPDIDFKISAGDGLNIFVGAGKIHYQWSKPAGDQTELYRMDVSLINGNREAVIAFEDKQPFYEQYYTHLTGENGIRAYGYKKITYRDVYPNIDWVFSVNREGKVEHDFVIRPGGKVSDIQLQYTGTTEMRLNNDGGITAATPFGTIRENAPYSFQQDGKTITSSFVLEGNTLRFNTAAHQGILTIDPVLEWGTYFGGTAVDLGNAITTDAWGNIYMVGQTVSTANIATSGVAFNTFNGGTNDAFISRFNKDGDCIWAMYYGGDKPDIAKSVACDTSGYIYFAGNTQSTAGIATPGSHHETIASSSSDAFLVKMDSAGNRIWGTYFGGASLEGDNAISLAVSKSGSIYLCGNTRSNDGIALNSTYQSTPGGDNDAFIAKFTTNGVQLWGTYFGGTNAEIPYAVAVSNDENICIVGSTQSVAGIATPNAHRTTVGGLPANRAAFIAKFNSQGDLQWGTYYGGNATDIATTVTFDPAQNIIVGGITSSDTGVATSNSHQPTRSAGDEGFIVKFNPTGQRLWGTYYGGTGNEWISAVTIGNDSIIYITGRSPSTTGIATADGYQPIKITESGTFDAGILVKMAPDGSRIWGSYFAGNSRVRLNGIAIDATNNIYLAGDTRSATNIADSNSYQPTLGGSDDAILIKFNDCAAPAMPSISGTFHACNGVATKYYTPGVAGANRYTWIIPTGWSGTSITDSISVVPTSTDGIIRLVAHNSCGRSSDTQTVSVTVSKIPKVTALPAATGCFGDTITLKTNYVGGTTYKWLKDGNAMTYTDTQILVTQSGAYQVISNDGVCVDTALGTEVIINPLPIPEIGEANGVLHTTHPYQTYQWYYNGSVINGATQATCEAKFTGTYKVYVTDTNGCSSFSEDFHYDDKNSVADITAQFNEVHVYPNPAKELLYLQTNLPGIVSVLSFDGKTAIKSQKVFSGKTTISIKELPSGIYFLNMQDAAGHNIYHGKLTKL